MAGQTHTDGTGLDDVIVVALGGNAIAREGDLPTIDAQIRRIGEAMAPVVQLLMDGRRVVLTHGNGPVVGNIVLRAELAGDELPVPPLYISGADSEGGIGLLIQQVLGNLLRAAGSSLVPATVVTQVVVDAHDPAFLTPTKPIGPYYAESEARDRAASRGWTIARQPSGRWRRVVPSPCPLRIVEAQAVASLLDAGAVPIAAGGGGVPVVEQPDGSLEGVDAVVDKDWASVVLAHELGASTVAILMEDDAIKADWGTPAQRPIRRLSADQADALSTTLPRGSVGPKVAAAAWFAHRGGTTLICYPEGLAGALQGRSGTRVEP